MKKLAHEKKDESLEYELENVRYDEFIGFNPFLFIPGLAVVIGLVGVTTVVGQEEANAFYGCRYHWLRLSFIHQLFGRQTRPRGT